MNDPLPQTAEIKSRGYGGSHMVVLFCLDLEAASLPRSCTCVCFWDLSYCVSPVALTVLIQCRLSTVPYCLGHFCIQQGNGLLSLYSYLIPAFANPVALYSLTLSFSNPCVLVHLGYCHRIPGTGRLTNNRNLFLVYLVAGKSKIKMLTDLVSCEGPPPSS